MNKWAMGLVFSVIMVVVLLFMLPLVSSLTTSNSIDALKSKLEQWGVYGYAIGALTDTRVPYVSAGNLADDANFTYTSATDTLNLTNINAPTGGSSYIIAAPDGWTNLANLETSDATAAAVQTAITTYRDITFSGTFTHDGTKITIPSNTRIRLEGSITFENSVADGSIMFENSDTTNGNSNIIFEHGTLDGNASGQAAGTRYFFNFVKVSNSKVDCTMQNITTYGSTSAATIRGEYVAQSGCYSVEVINRAYPNIQENYGYDASGTLSPDAIIISNMQSGWTQQVATVAADVTDYYVGSQCYKWTSTNATAAVAYASISPAMDITKAQFHVAVKITDATKLSLFQFWLYEVGGTRYMNITTAHNDLAVSGEWVVIDFVPTVGAYGVTTSASFDPQNCNLIKIGVTSTAGQTCEVKVGRVWATYPTTYGLVTFTIDDGFSAILGDIVTYFDTYGYAAVLGINPTRLINADAGYMTAAQLKTLEEKGWDIVGHSYTHRAIDFQSMAGVEDQILKCQDWMINNGFEKGSRFFIMPYTGAYNADGLEILEKYIIMNRSTSHGNMSFPVYNHLNINAITLNDGVNTLTQAKACIDMAVRRGQWVNLYIHATGDSPLADQMSAADFLTLVQYVNSSGAKVVTWSEVLDRYEKNTIALAVVQDRYLVKQADVDLIVTAVQDMTTGTIAVQPGVPRCVTVTQTGAGAPGGTVTVTGINARGRTVTDTITVAAGTNTVTGKIPFAKITAVAGYDSGAGNTLSVGTSDTYGLTKDLLKDDDVLIETRNGVSEALGTINTEYGTIAVSATSDDDEIIFTYKANINAVN